MGTSAQMRHENRVKLLFPILLLVISSPQCALPQDINTSGKGNVTFVISNVKEYRQSIRSDSLKRMVLLSDYLTPLFTDWKYAIKDNFTHCILYSNPAA